MPKIMVSNLSFGKVSKAELQDLRAHPEKYQSLIVSNLEYRVSDKKLDGFSYLANVQSYITKDEFHP